MRLGNDARLLCVCVCMCFEGGAGDSERHVNGKEKEVEGKIGDRHLVGRE